MLEINGKLLSSQEVFDRLKVSLGLPKDAPNSDVQIKEPIVFWQSKGYQQLVPMVSPRDNSVFYKPRYAKSFGFQIKSNNTFIDGDGVASSESVVLYNNKTVKEDTTIYLYDGSDRLMFQDGSFTVNAGQEDVLLFLRMSERNQTNHKWMLNVDGEPVYKPTNGGFLIYENKPKIVAETDYLSASRKIAAQALCFDESKLSNELAIDMATSYGMSNVARTPIKQIRVWLSSKAEQMPDKFIKDLTSQSYRLSAQLKTAFDLGIIVHSEQRVKWGKETPYYKKNGGVIMQLPRGVDANKHEVLAAKLVEKGDSQTIQDIQALIKKGTEHIVETKEQSAIELAAMQLGIPVEKLLALKEEKA
jgi:hypothetical protein